MKLVRSPYFNTSSPELWKDSTLRFRESGGKVFVAKALFTGFKLEVDKIELGPIIIRKYIKEDDETLGMWSDNCAVVELKYQDSFIDPPQDSPVSIYVEPFWFMHSFYLGLQLFLDGWIGMYPAHHFNNDGKGVGVSGSHNTQVADSFHSKPDPSLYSINLEEFLKLISAQYGNLEAIIDRYSVACCEILDEGIVDFTTCLDGMLGYKLDGELSHRISARGALLLTKDEKKLRKDYYYGIKYIYKQRSNIVHGNTSELTLPTGIQKTALIALGVNLSGDYFDFRGEIAEFIRAKTRQLIIDFINNENHLNKNWLEDLELGL